jgi:type IV pilus assembly protein PilX
MKTCSLISARAGTAMRRARPTLPRRQGGAILFIALIVLVAMTLAGIAMIRSVDTALGIAGNMAFKQASIQGTDRGVNAGFNWLIANSSGTTLQTSNPAVGYYSSRAATEPDWFDNANWATATSLPNEFGSVGSPDAAGNVVRYVVHRMCNCADVSYNANCAGSSTPNVCGLYYPISGGAAGGSMSVGSAQFEGIPQIYYRITTRVDGPRNTVSITQVTVLIQV